MPRGLHILLTVCTCGFWAPVWYLMERTPAAASGGVNVHTVREDGRNGSVAVYNDRIVRQIRKWVGSTDTQTIPMKAISGIHLDRRTLGSNVLHVTVGARTYEWKSPTAEALADQINAAIYG